MGGWGLIRARMSVSFGWLTPGVGFHRKVDPARQVLGRGRRGDDGGRRHSIDNVDAAHRQRSSWNASARTSTRQVWPCGSVGQHAAGPFEQCSGQASLCADDGRRVGAGSLQRGRALRSCFGRGEDDAVRVGPSHHGRPSNKQDGVSGQHSRDTFGE